MSLRDDPVLGEVGECALEEVDRGRGALVGMDLGVGEPGVVVDDRVHVVDAVTVPAVLA